MIRLLIADDHPIVREGLKRILHGAPDIEVCGEAETGDVVLPRARELSPDVLLLDITMPGAGFLSTLQRLRAEFPDLRVLVLSVQPEQNYAIRAIRAGAAGYLTKERSPEELELAIRRVHGGGIYLTDAVAEQLAAALVTGAGVLPHEVLSDREYEVFRMIGAGKAVGAIAKELRLSPKTVSTYRSRILDKTGLASNADIIRYVIEHELI